MATPFLDDFLYDIPTRPSLRIAPLQDPLPAPPIASIRPSPLEPNAQVNIDNEANKLDGRRKALAQAKSLDDIDPEEWETAFTKNLYGGLDTFEFDDSYGRPYKKTKVYDPEQNADFVQLPKPSTKAKEDKPRPFRPISVLNELHEPPPSAALFPPITPNVGPEKNDNGRLNNHSSKAPSEKRDEPMVKRKVRERRKSPIRVTRTYTRGRTKWSEEEIDDLVKGVTIYGTGRWKNILEHPDLHFKDGRTPTDLKDRFRVCFPPDKPHKWARPRPEKILETDTPAVPEEPPVEEEPVRKRARKRHWTDKEDEELKKGFHLYGYDWARMVKDPDLHFDNRSSGQVRDRFRLKFKDLYANDAVAGTPQDAMAGATQPVASKGKVQIAEQPENKSASLMPDRHHDNAGQKPRVPGSLAPSMSSGLLNGEDEANRLSNSILRTGLYLADENVTLAPVLWEDLAQKPLFALD